MNDKHSHLILPQNLSDNEIGMIGFCRLILGLLVIAIIWTGVSISIQTQAHHEAYRNLQQLKKELTNMQVEEQRLLIEQQTFSATPQVARRAVSELGMFFPEGDSRQVIAPTASHTQLEAVQ